MKLRSPYITLLTGAVLAVGLWIASMVAASPAPAGTGYGTAASTAGATPAVTASPATSSPAAVPSATSASATAASTSPSGFVIPPHANYVGEVMGNLGSIAIVVHDTSAVAYFCNGGSIEAWMSGVPDHGKLNLTGKNNASAQVDYALGHARGWVNVDGTHYLFSIIAVHAPSGLYRSIAVVRGATVKAGWIVLANGQEVGSLETDPNSPAPTAQKAPPLNTATRTANDGGVTLTATPIDAETGSGF
jgi:serine/threonine-protein kinase